MDRGKRSEDKTSESSTTEQPQTEPAATTERLPDFESCYEKRGTNLDGYPCKQYGRYPDKFDRRAYYECGAQPDGNMKIEHKRCPKGEEFSPEYLECVATEYLKMIHRKRRMPEFKKKQKNEHKIPEPEDSYDDDKELPNEWIDASHVPKVPNEFKSKEKNRLRIFHLHCKRNSSEEERDNPPVIRSAPTSKRKGQRHNVRSYVIRTNKKDAQEEKIEEDDDDEYEDDEEEYEEDVERSTRRNEGSFEQSPSTGRSTGASTAQPSSTENVSNKVLLDADIRVNREFETALKNILGKGQDEEKELQRKQDNKDSIVIKLSGDRAVERAKRNFLKSLFSKKNKQPGEDPEKEGVVSMLTLINGLPSEYERDELLQKLERRKMMNSHLHRIGRLALRKRKRKTDMELRNARGKTIREGTQLQSNDDR